MARWGGGGPAIGGALRRTAGGVGLGGAPCEGGLECSPVGGAVVGGAVVGGAVVGGGGVLDDGGGGGRTG